MRKRIIPLLLALLILFSASGLLSCGQESEGPGEGTGETGNPEGGGDNVPAAAGKVFYVSADGSDDDPGTEEKPLASFAGAVKAVREYKAENGLPEGGIEVVFAAGRYMFDSQIVFTQEDSGEEDRPVIYRAAEGAEVTIDGGVLIDPSAFVPASDDVKAKITDEGAKSMLLEADLAKAGCYDLDDSKEYVNRSNAMYYTTNGYRQELYVDNERQRSARWPNTGYETGGSMRCADNEISELTIPGEKAALWAGEPHLRLAGYPYIEWSANNIQDGIAIDTDRSVLTFLGVNYFQLFGNNDKNRYYIYNALCELDSPGEYYWDVEAGKLYYYPDGDIKDKKIVFSQLAGEWFVFGGGSDIGFEGLIFENARSAVFSNSEDMKNVTHRITAKNCVFRDLGTYAFLMSGYGITVENCDFYNIGAGCIDIESGEAAGYIGGGNVIYNCLFHDWSQTYFTGTPAVSGRGYGFTISHNEMYNSPHSAIQYRCGDSLIEYNYIHDVCLETDDAGAVYSGRRWDWSKNILRYNYIKDVSTIAFYLDDMLGGQTLYGNLVVNCESTGIVSSGKYNFFINNILVDIKSDIPISIDGRALDGSFGNDHVNYTDGDMWDHMRDTDYLSDVMRLAVPVNLLMLEQSGFSLDIDDPGAPSYNTAMNNIVYNRKYGRYNDAVNNTVNCNIQSNLMYAKDPGFTDAENGDFTLRSDSRVFRDIPTFVNIDLSDVGLVRN